jgi:ketosteroid isomerase-like protein
LRISAFFIRTALSLAIVNIFVVGNLSFQQNAARASQSETTDAQGQFQHVQTDISKALSSQSKAWNDGDLSEFMDTYSRRADTSYVSKDTQVYGFDAIEARYKKRYGDNRESMGTLTFSDLKFVDVAPTSAICIGHWQVEKKDHEKLSGVFSLVFVKEGDRWKILHDHTS